MTTAVQTQTPVQPGLDPQATLITLRQQSGRSIQPCEVLDTKMSTSDMNIEHDAPSTDAAPGKQRSERKTHPGASRPKRKKNNRKDRANPVQAASNKAPGSKPKRNRSNRNSTPDSQPRSDAGPQGSYSQDYYEEVPEAHDHHEMRTETLNKNNEFEPYPLDRRCFRVLQRQNILSPTPIQAKCIPIALEGRDLIGTAQTGTGKTLGYVLPTLSRLSQGKGGRNRMLILVPTRELCLQVSQVIHPFARELRLRHTTVYGGVGMNQQIQQLKRGCDIIVATPGRLLDHVSRGNIKFPRLEMLVIDEADRMLDMGFLPDLRRIIALLPKERQTLMFSATFAASLERLASNMLQDPERIQIGAISQPVDQVRQLLYPVRDDEKQQHLLDFLNNEDIENAIVFMRTKVRTDRLSNMLRKKGHRAVAIHGDLQQSQRQRAIEGFRTGKYNLLVATDVAARGLDIDDISHVINYDIPLNADDYVHRIGRTARATKEGDAVTFVTPGEHEPLAGIEKSLGRHMDRKQYDGAPMVLSTWNASPPKSSRPMRRRAGRRRR